MQQHQVLLARTKLSGCALNYQHQGSESTLNDDNDARSANLKAKHQLLSGRNKSWSIMILC